MSVALTSEKGVYVGYALRAEMRLPGEATLQFSIEPVGQPERSRLVQTARFRPRGLLGLAYWYGGMPLHGIVFRRMLAGIRRLAEADARAARRAKESGAAGQVATVEPSQSTVPGIGPRSTRRRSGPTLE